MEVDEEPVDPTDLVEEMSPVPGTGTESKETPAAGMTTPPRVGESSHSETGLPIMGPGDDLIDPIEESQNDTPRNEKTNADEAEEGFSLVEEILELREMDATPAVTPPSLKDRPETENKDGVAEHLAPTSEGYVTPTGLLSAAGSPS